MKQTPFKERKCKKVYVIKLCFVGDPTSEMYELLDKYLDEKTLKQIQSGNIYLGYDKLSLTTFDRACTWTSEHQVNRVIDEKEGLFTDRLNANPGFKGDKLFQLGYDEMVIEQDPKDLDLINYRTKAQLREDKITKVLK